MVNFLATRLGSDLSAGVAFYSSAPDLEDVPRITTPLMIQSAWERTIAFLNAHVVAR